MKLRVGSTFGAARRRTSENGRLSQVWRVSGGEMEEAQEEKPKRRSSSYSGQPWIRVDESVSATLTATNQQLPTLYIDDYTVLDEVDLTELRRGDHCIVGLNPVRKIFSWLDAMLMHLGSWEILRAYHHFILFDDVASISEEGVPLRADGAPAMICEYSNTPSEALAFVRKYGILKLLENCAAFHSLPLHDYTTVANRGVFRVRQSLTEEDRDRIVEDCKKLMDNYEPYDLVFTNCESAAFFLSHGSNKHGRFVTPQVPMMLWAGVRTALALVGAACLMYLPSPAPGGAGSPVAQPGLLAALLQFVYHTFATVPVVLQTEVHLVRTAVHLTDQRTLLGTVEYHHLLMKEVGRAIFVGGFATGTVAAMPTMVRNTGWRYTASFIALNAFVLCGLAYAVLTQFIIRALRRSGYGVPVPIFKHDGKVQKVPGGGEAPKEKRT